MEFLNTIIAHPNPYKTIINLGMHNNQIPQTTCRGSVSTLTVWMPPTYITLGSRRGLGDRTKVGKDGWMGWWDMVNHIVIDDTPDI